MSSLGITFKCVFVLCLGAVALTFVLWFHYGLSASISSTGSVLFGNKKALFGGPAYKPPTNTSEFIDQNHSETCKTWTCRNKKPTLLRQDQSVTIVSAYFNLGTFPKGSYENPRSSETYWNWAKVFSKVNNSVLFYSDDAAFARYILDIRRNVNQQTCTCLVERSKLWSFSIVARISQVFSEPGYPKHLPNTVLAEYGASMHAKYELMHAAVSENVFATEYFAWLDVGLYRALVEQLEFSRVRPFELVLPPKFDRRLVAYTMVAQPDFERRLDDYFRDNLVWVCGCFFLAEKAVMKNWTEEYLRFVDLLLYMGLASTDQQVIYAMFNKAFAFSSARPRVHIQQYVSKECRGDNLWFCLGYLCRNAGFNKRNSSVPSQDVVSAKIVSYVTAGNFETSHIVTAIESLGQDYN